LTNDAIAVNYELLPANQVVLRDLAQGVFADERAFLLRLQAEHLSLIQGFEESLALDAIAVAPFSYQVKAAQTVLRRFRGRGLLCDEVGLGKTIEAGLILKEYMLRGLARKVLIITPPGLVRQWQEEMESKFRIDFVTHDDERFQEAGEEAWRQFDLVIASLTTARRPEHREVIAKIHYDLVIIDEVHHLKNRNTVSWKFANALQKKYLLLLTATPVQNKLNELYNLITLLKPGQLKTEREFRQQFVVRGDPRLPKNRGMLRELLADVMVRNTRSQVNITLPPRRAHTIRLKLSQPEQELYAAVSEFVRRAFPDASPAVRFTLQLLQREIGSSAVAARLTLERLTGNKDQAVASLSPAQRAAVGHLADMAAAVSRQSKAEALLRLLSASEEKAIIFTHFLATLDYLAQLLEEAGYPYVTYHGGLTKTQKDAAVEAFAGPARIFLSTEAAGEGRNLQFCRRMINFDLPWNPMRIEQRVGRIHRIGQTREVEIYNLCAEGTIEDYILDILDSKINMFEMVIGEMDMVLGNMEDERDFDDIVMDIWTKAHSDDEVAAEMEELGENMVRAHRAYLKTREYDGSLFGQDFGTELA
jgi:SNF2 family DNA or RNA helicase